MVRVLSREDKVRLAWVIAKGRRRFFEVGWPSSTHCSDILPGQQRVEWSNFWQFLTEESELKDWFHPPEVVCTNTHTRTCTPHAQCMHMHAPSSPRPCAQGEDSPLLLTEREVKDRLFTGIRKMQSRQRQRTPGGIEFARVREFRELRELELRARYPYSETDFAAIHYPTEYLAAIHTLSLVHLRRPALLGDKVRVQTKHTHTQVDDTHIHIQALWSHVLSFAPMYWFD